MAALWLALLPALASARPDEATPPAAGDHWAFLPIHRPAIPVPAAAPDPVRIRNPIDAFLSAEQLRHGLQPQPDAPRDILLRRVHLDLTGLPPSRTELHAFLADSSTNAYERAVDRLLDSPHHGERWARHWMDVWRYADWYGRRSVPDVWNSAPQIWRWRDWIVRSLNNDLGYDRMVVEMLAADEVAPDDDEAAVATGFLVRSWYALNPNQWRRDIVEHTGKAFLGLTFNCAHCHDHKYDPISHTEYFQFRAFFEPLGLRQDWVQGEPDPGPFQKYDYSTLRKIVRHGAVRVLDEDLAAPTPIYLRGDERDVPKDKPTASPDVPGFLRFAKVQPQEILLPPTAHHPGIKPWIRDSLRHVATTNLVAARAAFASAENALRTLAASSSNLPPAQALAARVTADAAWTSASNQVVVAQAALTSLEARLAADHARFIDPSPSTNSLMSWASHAERFAALRTSETRLSEARQTLSLREAEAEISTTRRLREGLSEKARSEAKAKDDEAIAKLRTQIADLTRAVESANLALNSNSVTYTSIGPSYPDRSTGRRTALARWITDPRNPLTARVAVNHVWARHFHAPLVTSTFDFGRNGSMPSHPELLDWLASELVAHRWSLKHLHRLIVTSSAYRQKSAPSSPATDPENRLLTHANLGRLESEIVRDAMLSISGDLDPSVGGPVLPNTEANSTFRRSVYYEVYPEAGGHDTLSELFDPPNPNECYRRSTTILPQQALALANSKFSHDRSRSLAGRIASPDDGFIVAAFEHVLARSPSPEEIQLSLGFLARQEAEMRSESFPPQAAATAAAQGAVAPPPPAPPLPAQDAALRARTSLIHALFNHNDFIAIR